jgi:NADPH:quinone reductase-like Zn-dependent oxidoreductase
MRAVTIRQHGGPEVLIEEELPDPQPGPGQVRVRVEAVAMNHLDIWVRQGLPGLKLHYPHILGCDIAGEIDVIGDGVTGVSVGQKIVVNPGVSCGRCRECLLGRDNLCRDYGILGEHRDGGYADYLVIPVANVLPRPPNLSVAEAAAFPLTMLTAWQMLVRKAQVMPGETVLVLGAASGVGTAAVQIAKLLGARVIATATSDDKLERARGLGADDGINTQREDLVEGVRAAPASAASMWSSSTSARRCSPRRSWRRRAAAASSPAAPPPATTPPSTCATSTSARSPSWARPWGPRVTSTTSAPTSRPGGSGRSSTGSFRAPKYAKHISFWQSGSSSERSSFRQVRG